MGYMAIAKPGVNTDQFHKVIDEVGGDIDGLEARYAAETEDGLRIVTVWKSQQHAERFFNGRLATALRKVLGPEPAGVPEMLQGELVHTYTGQLVS